METLPISAPNEGLSGKYFVGGDSYPSQAGARQVWEYGQTYNYVEYPRRCLVKEASFADGFVAPAGAGKDF